MTDSNASILFGLTQPPIGAGLPDREPGTLWDELRRVIAAVPDNTAILDARGSVTFRELDEATRRVAAALAARGVEPRQVVGLVTANNVRTYVCMLAIVRLGAICVPLDPRDPPERTRDAIERVGVTFVVTRDLVDDPDLELTVPSVSEQELDADPPDDIDEWVGDPDDIVIIFLTSGSTGRAKAVPHSSARLVRMLWDQASYTQLGPGSRGSNLYPLSFIGSVVVGGGVFFAGATVCVHDVGGEGTEALVDWLEHHEIEFLAAVPSVLSPMLAAMARREVVNTGVRVIGYGAEGFARDEVDALRRAFPNARVANAYGSQESGPVTWFEMEPGASVADGPIPAGTPHPGYGVAVIDPDGKPVPVGEHGEVALFGKAVIDHYWRDPELDDQRFVSLPDGTRALRTGDLGRVHHDQLEVLGRLDGRVKVRGNAVDTLEVEHALTALDEVLDAAVTPVTTADGATRLVAHVQLIPVDPPTVGALRRELARTLPTFAVPSRVEIVSHVPRTPRGKVDRAALREQSLVVTPRDAPVAASDALEAEVIAHFEEILGLEGVGATDDFFELGGDSLDAVELVLALEKDSKVRLLPTQLLASATPRALAVALRDGPTRPCTVLPLTFGRPGRIPLVCLAGGPGQALAMLPLANRLGSRAVYGVQSRGLEGREPFDRTIEARARTHIEDLRRVQPTGPYFLGGHSLGGMVAFEMMRQLRAAGEHVPLLVLLDADSSAGSNGGALDGVGRMLRDLYPGDGLRARSKRWVRLVYVWSRRRSAAAISRFRRLDVNHRREALQQINADLARKYRPVPAPGPALLVRVHSEDEPWRLARPRDLGWEALITSDLTITRVPGHHIEMTREPEVAEVARVVRAALDAIDPPTVPDPAHRVDG